MAVAIHIFGPLEVVTEAGVLRARDFGGVKPRQLLSILCAHRRRSVTKERLADLVWGDALPANVAATLETYVSNLRRRLKTIDAASAVVTEPGGYRVEAELDLDRFDALRARKPSTRADLDAAIALARGEVLADDPLATWAVRLRGQYRERLHAMLLDAARGAIDDGDHAAGLARATELLDRDRTYEQAYRVALAALRALGRVDEATRLYERCRTALRDELGVQPGAELVELHAAIVRGDAPTPVRRASAPATPEPLPLIGRSAELAVLVTAGREILAGASGVVIVEGEPGIGKSRLVEELVAQLGVAALRSKCSPLERELAFAPLARALRSAGPVDAPRFSALGEILPELGTSGLPPEVARTHALEALCAVLAERTPCALVIDDAQWVDPSTLAAVGYVLARTRNLLVLLALRSAEAPVDHPARQLPVVSRIELGPLARAELASHCPDSWYERTGGNPLFVVELRRAQCEELPPELRTVLIARSRAAGPDAQRTLAIASVIGRSFAPEILAQLGDARLADVLEQLEALGAHQLVTAVGERFDFRHDLIREALYDSISPARRRYLHGRTLAALEAAGATAAELVPHAELAGAHELAVRYALDAGIAASAVWANFEAVAHLERAQRLVVQKPDLVEPELVERLRLRLGRLLVTVGRAADAEPLLRAVLEAATARGDDRVRFDVLEALAIARHRGLSSPSTALPLAREALDVARRAGESSLLIRAHTLVGSPLTSLGQLDEGLAQCQSAVAEAERAGVTVPAFPIGRIALTLHHQTRERESLEWGVRAEAAALAQHDEETMLMVRWVRALSCMALGRYQQAQRALDAIRHVGRGEEVFWHARVPNTWGALFGELCLHQRALDRNLASHDLARSRRGGGALREAEIQALLNVAADHLALGALAAARSCIETARGQVNEIEYSRFRWVTRMHYLDARLAVVEQDATRALAAADACTVLADKYGMPLYQIRASCVRAEALAFAGKLAPARRAAREAAIRAEALDMPGVAWRAWWTAASIDHNDEDRRKAARAVLKCAEGLDEPMRSEFLAAVPVPP